MGSRVRVPSAPQGFRDKWKPTSDKAHKINDLWALFFLFRATLKTNKFPKQTKLSYQIEYFKSKIVTIDVTHWTTRVNFPIPQFAAKWQKCKTWWMYADFPLRMHYLFTLKEGALFTLITSYQTTVWAECIGELQWTGENNGLTDFPAPVRSVLQKDDLPN